MDHILRLRAQCIHNVRDNIAVRRHLVDELHKASWGTPRSCAQQSGAAALEPGLGALGDFVLADAGGLQSASMANTSNSQSLVTTSWQQQQGRGLRGGVQLSTSGCCRGRALSMIRTHSLVTQLHSNLVENHKFIMVFIEELYNTHLLPRPDVVACTFVKCHPFFPDDLAFATAVGIVHGRLDDAGNSVVVGETHVEQPAAVHGSDATSVGETSGGGQEEAVGGGGLNKEGGTAVAGQTPSQLAARTPSAPAACTPSAPPSMYHWFSASQEMSPARAVAATVGIDV